MVPGSSYGSMFCIEPFKELFYMALKVFFLVLNVYIFSQ